MYIPCMGFDSVLADGDASHNSDIWTSKNRIENELLAAIDFIDSFGPSAVCCEKEDQEK